MARWLPEVFMQAANETSLTKEDQLSVNRLIDAVKPELLRA
jgi:hypothetical protein